jgi:hypothetical protein
MRFHLSKLNLLRVKFFLLNSCIRFHKSQVLEIRPGLEVRTSLPGFFSFLSWWFFFSSFFFYDFPSIKLTLGYLIIWINSYMILFIFFYCCIFLLGFFSYFLNCHLNQWLETWILFSIANFLHNCFYQSATKCGQHI